MFARECIVAAYALSLTATTRDRGVDKARWSSQLRVR